MIHHIQAKKKVRYQISKAFDEKIKERQAREKVYAL